MSGSIDIVCNLYDPEAVRKGTTGIDETFKRQVRMDKRMWGGVPVSQYLRKMDRAGIERSLLIAVRAGDLKVRGSFELPYERVEKVCAKYPDRFSGLAGVDPFRGMTGLRDLERAVKEMGFVGAGGLLVLLGLITWRIWRTAQLARDEIGRLICVGVLCMFVFHIFENVGMNLGIMPVTGIPLPFVSYGGSAMIATFAAMGLVMNVHMRRFS